MTATFNELTTDEAKDVARQIVKSSNSEDEIERRLTEVGFDGNATVICSQRCGPLFQAMVMTRGPRGEVISV